MKKKLKSFNEALNAFLNGQKIVIKMIDSYGVTKELETRLQNDILAVYLAQLVNRSKTNNTVNVQYFS